MWVIIQGIPLNTTQKELQRFLKRQLGHKGWFGLPVRQQTRLKSAAILRMTDRVTGIVECHGLAQLETLDHDMETLRTLNGHQLHGRAVTVRKYYHRSARPQGARRNIPSLKSERRRLDLHVEMA
ncbi:RNA recognition motif domain-containing protein [Sedimenticola selenatireducens]|uniref:RNA recognition motif domain-containing protein n=1 Tax=Sedimenticola selenatireducens TaxID=191960 RepID=UPI00048D8CBB|nr:RNA-binding protein [Sedimenticola selenatireducens]